MNKERLQICIDVMKRAENLQMYSWQDNSSGTLTDDAVESIEELHACGNTACFAGYVAISPEFKSVGGTVLPYGSPSLNGFGQDRAIMEFLELDPKAEEWTLEHTVIHCLVMITYSMEDYIGKVSCDWEPSDVIAVLEQLKNDSTKFAKHFDYDLYD